jgi:hypothetical protein
MRGDDWVGEGEGACIHVSDLMRLCGVARGRGSALLLLTFILY